MFLNVSQTQTAENLADGTNCSETHADASSVAGNWRLLSDDEKKRRRKLSYAKRDHSRVNLLGSFQRWRGLRKKLNMSSDKELADFLMDHYESAQKPSSLLPGKQEANNNIGQLRSLVESDIAISGQTRNT